MTTFYEFCSAYFGVGTGKVDVAVRCHVNEAWIAQIKRQIERDPKANVVGLDDNWITNVNLGTFLDIEGVIFKVVAVRKRGVFNIFMVEPFTGYKAARIVFAKYLSSTAGLIPRGRERYRVLDLVQALEAAHYCRADGNHAILHTDAGVCSQWYEEYYCTTDMDDLVRRIKNFGVDIPNEVFLAMAVVMPIVND